ncbi:MAG: hypothetical protein K2O97_15065 [Acetatifactor sp.]|jgi:hypothetical protein|nr:hypothetical protein [Acetatifactor sp.]MDE7046290.1 hypothetical protein [Acetatifactor sp.]
MAAEGVIGSKNIAVQQLKYSFEGSIFKKVSGCKGEDFCNVIGCDDIRDRFQS